MEIETIFETFIKKRLLKLTPREQKVIMARFGFKDGITHTLEEVAQDFGVTRERIRQIEAKAIDRLSNASGLWLDWKEKEYLKELLSHQNSVWAKDLLNRII